MAVDRRSEAVSRPSVSADICAMLSALEAMYEARLSIEVDARDLADVLPVTGATHFWLMNSGFRRSDSKGLMSRSGARSRFTILLENPG